LTTTDIVVFVAAVLVAALAVLAFGWLLFTLTRRVRESLSERRQAQERLRAARSAAAPQNGAGGLQRPDITKAQVAAVAGSGVGMAVSFGAPITPEQSDAILEVVKIGAPVLIASDAFIRFSRSKYVAPLLEAQKEPEPVVEPEEIE